MIEKPHIFLIIIFLLTGSVIKGQSIKISGRLYDKENDKTISNGVIFLNPGNQVTTSDKEGEYLFTCTVGVKHITTQVLGYCIRQQIFNSELILIL
jgi:hypothetical protein